MNETSQTPSCSRCGAALTPDALKGLCPRCLMALNLAAPTEIPGETGPHGTKVVKQPPPTPAEIAKHFPQLEILECLGRGGMGVVYKARQPRLDRLVALKIIAPEKEKDPQFAERFEREAQALARLNHPNIVTVYDFGEADGLFYLMMEFVDGVSLRQLLQTRKIMPEEALAIVPKICEALQFAHDQGVVHRDIKPENVLLDKQGRVKIADFGIAKIVGGTPLTPSDAEQLAAKPGEGTLTQDQVLGTPHYMAPEQVEHSQTVDHRADIYSLGVVFYEILTGELPLGRFAPPSKKVQMDVRLDEVVLHALEKEPERRYQHASEVKTDVETIAATQPRHGAAPAPSQVVSDERAGWQGLAGAWAILFSLMATAVVLGWFASDKSFSLPACLGAVFAVATVVTLFGRWLLSVVKGSLSTSPVPAPQPDVSPAESERIRREVRGPAIGLLVTGILNWVAIPLIVLVTAAVASQSPAHNYYVLFVPLATLVLSSVMIGAGLKMKRLEAYGLAITGSILALLITPGNVIGLPIGIWALVVLSHRQVRQAFGKGYSHPPQATVSAAPPTPRADRFWRGFAVAVALVLLAMILIPVGISLVGIVAALSRQRAHVTAQDAGQVVRVEEKLRREIEQRLSEAGWRVEGLSVNVTPDLKRAECRFGTARKDGLSENLFNAAIRVVPQGKNLWQITGDGQFQFLRFSVDTSAEMKPQPEFGERQWGTIEDPKAARWAVLAVAFGPEKEVTLTEFNNRDGQEALDLDTGTVFKQPKDMDQWSEEGLGQWVKENGVDLFVDHGPEGVWGLMTTTDAELKLARLENNKWGAISAEELVRVLAGDATPLQIVAQGRMKVYLPPKETQPPMTFAFKTSSGGVGILQITGYTDNPRGVKIRYKLVQSWSAAQSRETETRRVLAARAQGSEAARSRADAAKLRETIQQFISGKAARTGYDFEIWEKVPGSPGEYRIRSDVKQIKLEPESLGISSPMGMIYSLPVNNRFYIQWDALTASTLHYYGPFDGDPAEVLGLPHVVTNSPTFGPVIERVVTNMIDFDSGALVDLPLPTQPGERDQARYDWINGEGQGVPWMRAHGIDAIDANHGMIGVDLWLLPLERAAWQSLTPAALQEKLRSLGLPTAPSTDHFGDARGTYGFQTREGSLGIAQITDANLPRGVKLRYKLVK